jgi:hypothetical protein
VKVVMGRLLVNKPSLFNTPVLVLSWILFVISTVSLIVISQRASRISQSQGAD